MRAYWKSDKGKEAFPNNITAAIEKVMAGKYALICESSLAKYYVNKKPCQLTTIGDIIHPRSYGLVVRHGFPVSINLIFILSSYLERFLNATSLHEVLDLKLCHIHHHHCDHSFFLVILSKINGHQLSTHLPYFSSPF